MKEYKKNKNRYRLLYLLQFLFRNTDENHVVSVKTLIEELERMDIHCNRITIAEDIENLNAAGFEIQVEKGINNANWYHYGTRNFDQAELKMLVDAVSSAQFISSKKSQELIRKITELTSVYEAEDLKECMLATEKIKTDNPQLFYIVDTINRAISQGRRICFQYNEYTAEKKIIKRNNGETDYSHAG